MPAGTKVDDCFQKVRRERGDSSAAAICQSATHENLHTGGKPLGKDIGYRPKAIRNPKIGCCKDCAAHGKSCGG